MNYQCDTDIVERFMTEHCWAINLIGYLGFPIRSVGFLIYAGFGTQRHRSHFHQPRAQRKYAYFIPGYETRFATWDIVVRRMDLAFMTLAETRHARRT